MQMRAVKPASRYNLDFTPTNPVLSGADGGTSSECSKESFMKHFSPHRGSNPTASWPALIALLLVLPWAALAAETPRAGGELAFAVAETPPSFDGHRETTFAMIHPIAPHYSTLLRFDPHNYPKIVGDLAEKWSASRD